MDEAIKKTRDQIELIERHKTENPDDKGVEEKIKEMQQLEAKIQDARSKVLDHIKKCEEAQITYEQQNQSLPKE